MKKSFSPLPDAHLPLSEKSAQFQGGEADEGAEDGEDPEADGYFAVGDAFFLKVVMYGGHEKESFSAEVAVDEALDERGRKFENKDKTDNKEQDLLTQHDGDEGEGSAECETAGIPHDEGGGLTVVPEKTETGSGDSAGVDTDFTGTGDVGDIERSCEDTGT